MAGASASTTAQYAGIGVFVAIVLYVLLDLTRRSFNTVCFLTRGHDADADAVVAAGTGAGVQALIGLHPDDVAVLPTFTYRAASPPDSRGDNAKGAAAAVAAAPDPDCCSVCLDELREGALVRMLPSCKHYFHAECVDVWLLSRATCPVCRGSPGPEKVRQGVASLSPPLPQLRRFGAASVSLSPEGGETSGAKQTVSSRSPSPASFSSAGGQFVGFICKGRGASRSSYEGGDSGSSISSWMIVERNSRSLCDDYAVYVVPNNATLSAI